MHKTKKEFLDARELKEYREFALNDDMMKLAVGVVLGSSFNKVINSISDCLFAPIFIFLASKTGDEWRSWRLIPVKGLEFEIGKMSGSIVDFLLVSLLLYLIYKKAFTRIVKNKNEANITKKCSYCCSEVNVEAKRCKFCTSDIT